MPDNDQEPRYRCGAVRRFPLTSDSEVIYIPSLNRVCTLSTCEVQHLAACSQFLTLTEHVNNFAQRFDSSSDPRDLRAMLGTMVDAGLLLSYSNLMDICARGIANPGHADANVEWIVIPTRSRLDRLLKVIRSYVANAKTHGRDMRFFVSDQTPRDGATRDSSAELHALGLELGAEIFYAGVPEKSAFAKILCSGSSIPPDVVRFALFGNGNASANIGSNRNATLLQTCGSMFISVDDDTICETACVPGTTSEVRFRGEIDPTETWFFAERASARSFVERSEIDFVGAHSRMLGRRLDQILTECVESGGADLNGMCPHIFEQLCSGGGQVLSSYGGLMGDVGIYSVFPLLIDPSRATRERLTSSAESFAMDVSSREVVRQSVSPTIAHGPGASSLAACLGLDNREMLPPFFPPHRSEDGVFAYLLARSREGACVSHIPLTVLHDRPNARRYGDVATVRMSDLALSALIACPISIGESSASERLVRFGTVLEKLGGLSNEDFREWTQNSVLALAANTCQQAEETLKRACSVPDYWG